MIHGSHRNYKISAIKPFEINKTAETGILTLFLENLKRWGAQGWRAFDFTPYVCMYVKFI